MLRSARPSHGFTLIELLVSVSILLLLFGTIVTMFVASVRAVKAGYQVAEAMETQRGAFHIMEQDLSTVFTSRDYGDYYQFHGGPYGMSMVGLVRAADQYVTLGRVTYVLHPEVHADAVEVSVDADGDSVFAPTMSLLRFVEPGVTSLDSFPFYDSDGNPQTWANLASDPEFGSAIRTFLAKSCDCDPDNPDSHSSAQVELLKAKKRELWIRMLSGRDPDLPKVWITDREIETARENGLAEPSPDTYLRIDKSGNAVKLIADDYVVAENIRSERPVPNAVPMQWSLEPSPLPLDPDDQSYFPYFVYGRILPDTTFDLKDGIAPPDTWWRTSWNSAENLAHLNNWPTADAFEDQDVLSSFLVGNGTPIYDGTGSLLTPRLPEAIQVKFTFVYPAPYLTAAPYERNYEQIIDIPTAFTRTTLTEAP
ncbi:MAG: prepilin-type N-terminal cleavage/methylation domain-containing protein [Candidatus Hydrogenedentales bacterium]|jgi:prepilin-type N-terminal cleavage/methylation domain-containing protein